MTQEHFPIEIWEGMPDEEDSEKLGTFTYRSGSGWNTYSEETYTLPRRLRGITTICFVVHRKIHIKGFSFTKIEKAFEQLKATDYTTIYGDTFTVGEDAVEGIGNNVTIVFDGMDFSQKSPSKLEIFGRTPLEVNTIQLKCDDNEKPHMLDFKYCADYQVREFKLQNVSCEQKINFLFLPGCNFDFKWFRFSI